MGEFPTWGIIACVAVAVVLVGISIAWAVNRDKHKDAEDARNKRRERDRVDNDRTDVYAEVIEGFATVHQRSDIGNRANHDNDAGDVGGGDDGGVDCGCLD